MISKDTLAFLEELKLNNDKDWFDANRKRYQTAKKDVEGFLVKLIASLAEFDSGLIDLKPKECVFRIFRDVRFSKDKRPYKTNMGAYMSRGGRKSPYAGYYLHIEPGNNFLAAGVWMPPGEVLKNIRQEIDYNADEFKAILNKPSFKKVFPTLEGEKLKTAPRDYPKDHPEIEFLKHKSYLVMTPLKDKDLTDKGFIDKATKLYQEAKPLNDFINRTFD